MREEVRWAGRGWGEVPQCSNAKQALGQSRLIPNKASWEQDFQQCTIYSTGCSITVLIMTFPLPCFTMQIPKTQSSQWNALCVYLLIFLSI